MKLLLAEDTADLNRVVTVMLQHSGFEVDSTFDGQEALERIQENGYDGIILDIMMPKRDGISVLTELRKQGNITPVLLLTAKAEVDDRVAGLDAGADDYLPKPFAMKELLARVKAMTRRRTRYNKDRMQYADFSLDAETLALSAENTVRLSLKEFELLQMLEIHAEKELPAEQLLGTVWAAEPDAGEDTLWLYVRYLQRKLQSVASEAVITGSRETGRVMLHGDNAEA